MPIELESTENELAQKPMLLSQDNQSTRLE